MALKVLAGGFKKPKESGERGLGVPRKVDPDMLKYAEHVFKGIPVGSTAYVESNEMMFLRVNETTIEAKCILCSMDEEIQKIKLQSMGYESVEDLMGTLREYAEAVGMQILFARS